MSDKNIRLNSNNTIVNSSKEVSASSVLPTIGLTVTPSPNASQDVLDLSNPNAAVPATSHNSNTLNISTNVLNTSTSSFVSTSSSSSSSPNSTLTSSQHQQHSLHSQTLASRNLLSISSSPTNSSTNNVSQHPKLHTQSSFSNDTRQTNNNNNSVILINNNLNAICNNSVGNTLPGLNISNNTSSTSMSNLTSEQQPIGNGHFFTKKNFHKPTYCHHCTEMLWGLIGQGFICEGLLELFLYMQLSLE